MNTPAHALVNLACLSGGPRRAHAGAALGGALLPDLPMFGFYLWQRLGAGIPEAEIWGRAYFDPAWQAFFDVFNSIPLAALGMVAARWSGRLGLEVLCASVLLHCAFDLPFHREDAHGHFFPLSDWRFESPVSYWDPAHHGAWFGVLELALSAASVRVLWPRFPGRGLRALFVATLALGALAWATFYLWLQP